MLERANRRPFIMTRGNGKTRKNKMILQILVKMEEGF